MRHVKNKRFKKRYNNLPVEIQGLADKQFSLLKKDLNHPSLEFKNIYKRVWSARVTDDYRACAIQSKDGETYVWDFIGDHREYDRYIYRPSSNPKFR